jgi:hypothetical protein
VVSPVWKIKHTLRRKGCGNEVNVHHVYGTSQLFNEIVRFFLMGRTNITLYARSTSQPNLNNKTTINILPFKIILDIGISSPRCS